jgi:hypothetical protein
LKLIIQTALTGAAAMSCVMQFAAGKDTKTGKNLRLASIIFLTFASLMNLCWSLLERGEQHGSDDAEEL